jgi:transcriptional regulator with XRE-family HTH domain
MNPISLKVWMLRNGFAQAQIARDLGVSNNLVWKTVNGKERNARVIDWLLARGCPEKYVDLPQKAA